MESILLSHCETGVRGCVDQARFTRRASRCLDKPFGARIRMLGLNLKSLIGFAHDVQGYQVPGQNWLEADMSDVIAMVPPRTEKLAQEWWMSGPRHVSDHAGGSFQGRDSQEPR